MAPLRAADILNKTAELLAEGHKDFIFVFDRFWEGWLDVDLIVSLVGNSGI